MPQFIENRIAVYTSITKGYDNLISPDFISDKCDFFCFTDDENMSSNYWQVILLKNEFNGDDVRFARHIKLFPHVYLPEYRYTVWIDGNIGIVANIYSLVSTYFMKYSFVTFKNPSRNCIYDEAKECIVRCKDKRKIIVEQMRNYKRNNYPENNGLIESNFIFRDSTCLSMKNVMNEWWEQISRYSRRDQLSFNYVAWKYNFNYLALNENARFAGWILSLRPHNSNKIIRLYRMVNRKFRRLFIKYENFDSNGDL